MKQLIRAHLQDRSDAEQFRFSITCAECAAEWKSRAIRFSKAGTQDQIKAKPPIVQTLYQRERGQVLEHAVEEALQIFNVCPLCGRMVCDHCFIVCDDLDMCRSCAEAMQEQGEPVMEEPLGSMV